MAGNQAFGNSDSERPLIALTFDDGPNTVITPQVLDLLAEYDAVGSFFLIGQNVDDASARVARRAFDMGCEIANHTFTHPDMTTLSADEMRVEFDRTETLIHEITGKGSTFFRAPYIAINDLLYDTIDRCFITGMGCRDWEPDFPASCRIELLLEQARDGAIILLHDMIGNEATVEALKAVLPVLSEQNYRFVTVSQIFAAKEVDPWDKNRCGRRSFSLVPDDAAPVGEAH